MDRYINMFVNIFLRRIMSKGINAGFKAAEQAMSPRAGKSGRGNARTWDDDSDDVRAQPAPSQPWGRAPDGGEDLVISMDPSERKPARARKKPTAAPKPAPRQAQPEPTETFQMPPPAKPAQRIPEMVAPPLPPPPMDDHPQDHPERSKAEQARQAAREARAAVRP